MGIFTLRVRRKSIRHLQEHVNKTSVILYLSNKTVHRIFSAGGQSGRNFFLPCPLYHPFISAFYLIR